MLRTIRGEDSAERLGTGPAYRDVARGSPGWPVHHSCFRWPSSRHPGGLLFALADGSARFISDQLDLAIYRALATIRGGEPVTPPD